MVDIESVLIKHKFKYKKSLGQNFIFDEEILDDIARLGGADGQTIVEIGAGAGTLSSAIARRCKRLCTFEIDNALYPILNETLSEFNNVQLFTNDVTELGIDAVDMLIGEEYSVIANLPYYITTPLIFLFLRSSMCKAITCLVQKEVADRICAKSGGDFGALSAAVQAVGEPETVKIIKSWEFTPQPDVDSALIRIVKRNGEKFSDELFSFFKLCFTQKRKTLVNNLTSAGMFKPDIIDGLEKLGFEPTARAEQLGAEKLMELGKILGKVK